MAGNRAAFLKSLAGDAETGLASLSFHKKQNIFVRPLGGDGFGWVALDIATHLPHGRVGISPIVGVVYRPIEDLVKRLSSSWPSYGATLSTAVGYLTPERRFLEWVFDPTMDVSDEMAKIMRAVEYYGLPFMEEHASLRSIINELQAKRFTINDTRRYRLPAAYLLAGRKEEALRFIEQELEGLRERTDDAAAQFREYVRAFKDLSN
jgi:hypothetical protein